MSGEPLVPSASTEPPTADDTAPRLRKKTRRRRNKVQEKETPPCFIHTLPVELLGEILIFTESPKDVLAVARTSKFFCRLLLDPAQSFVWRSVRLTYPVPPPDPMSVFSEIGYASFLFDRGSCIVCGRDTDNLFTCFGLQVRTCSDHKCSKEWAVFSNGPAKETELHEKFLVIPSSLSTSLREVLPYSEDRRPLTTPDPTGQPGRHCYVFRRLPGFESIGEDADLRAAYTKSMAYRKESVGAYMTLCGLLVHWATMANRTRRDVTEKNLAFVCTVSQKHGWEKDDVKRMTQFGRLCHLKSKRLERATEDDFTRMKASIEEELIELERKRRNRHSEHQYQDNRHEVLRHYRRLESSLTHPVLPPLETFRKLPIVSTLQGSPTSGPRPIGSSFKNSDFVKDVLSSNLDSWREKARSQLAGVLGFANWKTASKTVVHPVDRVTARFRCKDCSALPSSYRNDECFNFAGACAHRCPMGKKDKRSKEIWKAENFVKDEQAISAIIQVVKMTDLDLSSKEDNLLITVCNVIGHSHRHENMQLQRSSVVDDLLLSAYRIPHGVVEEHTRPGHRALAARQTLKFGCRHCATAKRAGDGLSLPVSLAPLSDFNFDGLRSHLKAKHKIEKIRDEDILKGPSSG